MRLEIKKYIRILLSLFFLLTACSPTAATAVNVEAQSQATLATATIPPPTYTSRPPTETLTPTLPPPTENPTATAIPVVDSLKATVRADLLSCRYGPGSEYLYLFAFKKGAVINLIGRTDGNNWLMIENDRQCWIHQKFVDIQGDPQTLKIVYPDPDGYKLPVSPYYGPTTVLSAIRKEDKITVDWIHIPVSPGDYEDADMFQYIIEVWRCENGQIIFDPLASSSPIITFVDEAGCASPSHGRVYVQDKHGYAGPAEIPWPER
jgi:hypothetical protein